MKCIVKRTENRSRQKYRAIKQRGCQTACHPFSGRLLGHREQQNRKSVQQIAVSNRSGSPEIVPGNPNHVCENAQPARGINGCGKRSFFRKKIKDQNEKHRKEVNCKSGISSKKEIKPVVRKRLPIERGT